VMRNTKLIAFFSAMERFLYHRADKISIISESFRRNLARKGIPDEKMDLIPVWADPDEVQPMPSQNAFREANGLNGKFVLLYAGNLGLTSCLEDIVEAADLLRENPEICFVLVGEGVKKQALQQLALSKGLSNIMFLPYQEREKFSEVLASSDLSIVTLNQDSSVSSMPSKVFNLMASARAILSVAPPESELASLISASACGVNVPPGQPSLLVDQISSLMLQRQRLGEMGIHGREVLENQYSRKRCVSLYDGMLKRVHQGGEIEEGMYEYR
jgi:colanic acid biosynthesis glycosyl transferase WcaI